MYFFYLILKVFLALWYFGWGSFQREVDDIHRISQPTASRILDKLFDLSLNWQKSFIKFLSNNKLNNIQNQFMQMKGFPGVISATDSTNVQILCDVIMPIRNIVAFWIYHKTVVEQNALSFS